MIERLLYADVERNANNLLLDVMDKHFFRATTKSACNNTKVSILNLFLGEQLKISFFPIVTSFES